MTFVVRSAHLLPISVEANANSSSWFARLPSTIATPLISEIHRAVSHIRPFTRCCFPTSLPPPAIVCTVSPTQKAFLLRDNSYHTPDLDFGPHQCLARFSFYRARRGPHELGAVPVCSPVFLHCLAWELTFSRIIFSITNNINPEKQVIFSLT